MLTAVGKYLRKLRIDNSELLKDMAGKVGMSSAMLSAIENGKRNPPANFAARVEAAYNLAPAAAQEFIDALCETQDEVRINIQGRSAGDQRLAFSFARRFDELDEQSKSEIMSILRKERP